MYSMNREWGWADNHPMAPCAEFEGERPKGKPAVAMFVNSW
eukprot:SAG22_NODE_267_length_13330_cov_19.960396_5_plen_41_part_00